MSLRHPVPEYMSGDYIDTLVSWIHGCLYGVCMDTWEWMLHDRFHWKCCTSENDQLGKLKFLGTMSNSTKFSICICTKRCRGISVFRFGGFRGRIAFSGICLILAHGNTSSVYWHMQCISVVVAQHSIHTWECIVCVGTWERMSLYSHMGTYQCVLTHAMHLCSRRAALYSHMGMHVLCWHVGTHESIFTHGNISVCIDACNASL